MSAATRALEAYGCPRGPLIEREHWAVCGEVFIARLRKVD